MICSRCGLEKEIELFVKNKKLKSGYERVCKECRNIRLKELYENNKENYLSYQKKWQEENKEKYLERIRKHRNLNLGRMRQNERKYRDRNREKINQRMREYVLDNEEKIKEYRKQYYSENKNIIINRLYQWRVNNREHRNAKDAQRKNKLKNIGCISESEWNEIMNKFNSLCAYCGETEDITRDHIIPISNGGMNLYNNLVPACRSCNSSKGTREMKEWYERHGCFDKERYGKIVEHVNGEEVEQNVG